MLNHSYVKGTILSYNSFIVFIVCFVFLLIYKHQLEMFYKMPSKQSNMFGQNTTKWLKVATNNWIYPILLFSLVFSFLLIFNNSQQNDKSYYKFFLSQYGKFRCYLSLFIKVWKRKQWGRFRTFFFLIIALNETLSIAT